MNDRFKVHAADNVLRNSIGLRFYKRGPSDQLFIVKQIVMEEISIAEEPDDQIFYIAKEDAQGLMDDLWNAGIRPTDTRDRSETVKAMLNHIEDLRKVQTAFLDMTKKEAHQALDRWDRFTEHAGTVGDTKG